MRTIHSSNYDVLTMLAKWAKTSVRNYAKMESESDPNFFRWFFEDNDLEDFQNPDKEAFEKWLEDNCPELSKEEVIDFLRGEIECGNKIITSTIGQGGSGLDISDNNITTDLEDMQFNGLAELICDDIANYEEAEGSTVYEFTETSNEGNPLRIQVCVY